MARGQATSRQASTWSFFYLPLIVGLIIGATVASMTDQWWWATVGAVVGAAVGEVARRFNLRRGADSQGP